MERELMTSSECHSTNPLVVVALGSNLGDSPRIISDAIVKLRAFSDSPILASSVWQTSPVDCPPDSPVFLNAVVGFMARANETPESLLKKLQDLEREFGRKPKTVMNEPRPLDLDLIVFGGQVRRTEGLALPHPRAHLRKFVLCPLNEIAPELVIPGQGNAVVQLLAELRSDEKIERLA
jgi:2-amino-4-hydroxy-6-hydroxymethyldihydropteridine diphosphokinase